MPEYDMVLQDKDGNSVLVSHRLSWQYKQKYWLYQAELHIAGWRLKVPFHTISIHYGSNNNARWVENICFSVKITNTYNLEVALINRSHYKVQLYCQDNVLHSASNCTQNRHITIFLIACLVICPSNNTLKWLLCHSSHHLLFMLLICVEVAKWYKEMLWESKEIETLLCLRSIVASQHWIYPWQVVRKWTTPKVVKSLNLGTNFSLLTCT